MNVKVDIKCNRCDSIFSQKPGDHINHRGCPHCDTSSGEILIRKYLIENKINFVWQKKFDDCIGKVNKLKFDFYLPDINILIEFDGEQHFNPYRFYTRFKNGHGRAEDVIRNDAIKNSYCFTNHIPLIRISYWDINRIDEILSEQLSYSKAA
jgi:hypothetical protein